MVSKVVPFVVFLDVYPKRGPLQQLDIDDKEVTRLLQMFVSEEKASSLVRHDIDKNLNEVMSSVPDKDAYAGYN